MLAHYRHSAYYNKRLAEIYDLYKQGHDHIGQALKEVDVEWDNIQTGQQWVAENASENSELFEVCSEYGIPFEMLELRLHPGTLIEWLNSALTATRNLGDLQVEKQHLGHLGLAYMNIGETERAIAYFFHVLETGNLHEKGATLGNLGEVYYHLGDMEKAIDYFEQDLKIARDIGDLHGVGIGLGNLGLGKISTALNCFEKALTIMEKLEDKKSIGQIIGNIGIAYFHKGEINLAISYQKKHFEISYDLKDQQGENKAHWNLYLCYKELGKREEAIMHAKFVLDALSEASDPKVDNLKNQLEEWENSNV